MRIFGLRDLLERARQLGRRAGTFGFIAAVVTLYVASAALRTRSYGDHVSALVGFGCSPENCYAAQNEASLPRRAVVFRTGGYDGQFFYYLGRELFGGPRASVDSDPFRRARIGLPLLAGPLLAAGDLGRVLGLPITLLLLHLASVWGLARSPAPRLLVATFALNPFSLLCFLHSVADGAALSLAVLAALAAQARSPWRHAGLLLLALSMLTKEAMLLVAVALGARALLDGAASPRARAVRVAGYAASLVPMLVWWQRVGFSPGLAARHGGFPFLGLATYAPHAKLQQVVLIVVLVLAAGTGLSALKDARTRPPALLVLGTLALVSAATAGEYWATFANVARLFTPLVAAPALLEEAPVSPAIRRWVLALCSSLLLLTSILLVREATVPPLPYFVMGG